MIKFLSCSRTVVLEHGHVFEAQIAFQILNALGGKQQELRDLSVRRLPQLDIVANALHQDLMRAHGIHGVINALSVAMRLAFNAIERCWMHHGHYWACAMIG